MFRKVKINNNLTVIDVGSCTWTGGDGPAYNILHIKNKKVLQIERRHLTKRGFIFAELHYI